MHGGRTGYYILGEGVVADPPEAPAGAPPPKVSPLKFGRMFGTCPTLSAAEGVARFNKLLALGRLMNEPQPGGAADEESGLPAGYTYLGQFIAHEITFDSTGDLLEAGLEPENLRTPQLDLDSLYGGADGPRERPELYEADGVRLRVGTTTYVTPPGRTLPHDLPRDKNNQTNPRRALVGDERNDENLALAQTHVAFIYFHNRVVKKLAAEGHGADGLFEGARREVVRHFQWVVLHDFLARLVDLDVLDCVLRHGLRWFKADGPQGLFMPLEFSAAAFRIGHSMVRRNYDWNKFHTSDPNGFGGPASILELFNQTGFSRLPNGFPSSADHPALTLPTDWVIDWRRFYDFTPLRPDVPALDPARVNRASKLDTVLNFRLDTVMGFPDTKLDQMQKAITIRNLLRGFYLGLPSGEEVARRMGETPLTPEEVADGPHRELLSDPALRGNTPLWYYVLREAGLNGGSRLGRVGSRITAETLVGLIGKSPHSILDAPDWRPRFGRRAQGAEPEKFEMIDLLKFAFDGAVNPLG